MTANGELRSFSLLRSAQHPFNGADDDRLPADAAAAKARRLLVSQPGFVNLADFEADAREARGERAARVVERHHA